GLFSVLMLVVWMAGAGLAQEMLKDKRSVTVQGQGKIEAVPDIAHLGVEVTQEGDALDEVSTDVRHRMNEILKTVKAQGIPDKDIQTEIYQVRPRYEQDKRGNPHRTGFFVTNRIRVKVRDLNKVGKILSVVQSAGATTVQGPDFDFDNPQQLER